VTQVTDGIIRRTFRRFVRFMGPRWMTRERIETPLAAAPSIEVEDRAMYAMAAIKDAAAERVRLGVRYRFPIAGETPLDALLEIGRMRRVEKGPSEPGAAYAERLRRWLDDWKLAGTPWSVMEQVRAYCSPHAVRVRIFTNRGDCYTIDRDGTRSIDKGTAWDWDGEATPWARWWIVLYPDAGLPFGRAGDYGTASDWGAASFTWGSTATAEDAIAIRRIIVERKPAGTRCEYVIICHDDAHFDPSDALTLPDGTWGSVYKLSSGSLVKARFDDAAYWPGA
jgi:hypothetical protein